MQDPCSTASARPQKRRGNLSLFTGDPGEAQTPSGEWTLTEFYRRYIKPEVLLPDGAAEGTLRAYSEALKYWSLGTGDPPLGEVGAADCQAFRKFLNGLPGRKHRSIAVNTIRKHCTHVQRCLNLAGPPVGHRTENRDLFGWDVKEGPLGEIAERRPVPYIKRPRKQKRPVENIFRPGELDKLLGVCDQVDVPLIPGITPAAFWISLFTWLDAVGTRIKTTIQIEWPMIEGHVLSAPAEILKGRDDQQFWVSDRGLAAAERIRTADPRLFPYPRSLRQLHRVRERLMKLAGIYRPGLGFHGLRAALGSRVARKNPQAAQRQLGHADFATTEEFYLPVDVLEEAFRDEANPQLRLF